MTQEEPRREAGRVALRLLGAAGLLLCTVGIIAVWYCEWRVDRARQRAFDRVDQLLDRSADRLLQVQRMAAESKVSLEEVQRRLKDWTREEANKRVASRVEMDAKVERLAAGLRQGEVLLDGCRDAIQHVRQTLELGAELGLSIDVSVVDPLLERLAVLTGNLNDAVAAAETLSQRLGEQQLDESHESRLRQFGEVAANLLATFGEVDSRLAALGTRLSDSQDALRTLSTKIRRQLLTVAFFATVLLVWMASGQLCLFRRAWNC